MASSKSTAVAVNEEKPLATYDYGDAGGEGFEAGKDAFKMPWLRVAQGLTKQLETIDGMKLGDIFNTVTNEYWKGADGIDFIPALFKEKVVIWTPRSGKGSGEGSNFIGQLEPNDPIYLKALEKMGGRFVKNEEGKFMKPKAPDGNDLVYTEYAYGLQVLNRETFEVAPACIAFASTGLSGFNDWNTMAKLQTYLRASDKKRVSKPLYSHLYHITTYRKQRGDQTWFLMRASWANGDAPSSLIDPRSDAFVAAKSVLETVKSGQAEIDYSQQAGAEDHPGGTTGGKDENIPF